MLMVSPWTDILVEELRQMWAAGLSCTVIAKELGNGFTRNSVIGKAARLGLGRHKDQRRVPTVVAPRKQYKRVVRFRPIVQPPEPPREPKMRRLKLVKLQDHHCRWPIGNPTQRDFFFCAANKADGGPYCPWHTRAAFVQPKERIRP